MRAGITILIVIVLACRAEQSRPTRIYPQHRQDAIAAVHAKCPVVPRTTSNGILMPAVLQRVEPNLSKCPAVSGSGNSTVEAIIDRNGNVQQIKILRPISTCVDDAVMRAVQQWKFCPAEREGQALEMTMQLTVLVHYV